MQPKAAKKIGGMTPKKMTGGQDTEGTLDFDGTKYTIRKTQEKDELKICVSAPMPGAEAPVISNETLEEVVAEPSEEEINKKLEADGIEPNNATPEDRKKAIEELKALKPTGGKKKRKSSKKRKSMKVKA